MLTFISPLHTGMKDQLSSGMGFLRTKISGLDVVGCLLSFYLRWIHKEKSCCSMTRIINEQPNPNHNPNINWPQKALALALSSLGLKHPWPWSVVLKHISGQAGAQCCYPVIILAVKINTTVATCNMPVSALMLVVGQQERHLACKNLSGGVEFWRGYLSGARCRLAYGPADATATHCLLLQ